MSKFFLHQLPKKYPVDIVKQVQRHALIGLDLIELNESNLIEMGINTIHERKNIMRAIKILKNGSQSSAGVVMVKMIDSNSYTEMKMKFRISDCNIKVKHLL